MKVLVLILLIAVLGAGAKFDLPLVSPGIPDIPNIPGPGGPPPRPCLTESSTWKIKDLPVLGNDITLKFQKRLDAANRCQHFMQFRSLCTRYEVTYTTTHGLGVVNFNTGRSTDGVNLGTCPDVRIADQQFQIVRGFQRSSGWYHLYLTPFVLAGQEKISWGGYLAEWQTGPFKVWFS